MKSKILMGIMCMMPMMANAAMPYRTEQIKMPTQSTETYASEYRFYIGGGYNFSMWQNFTNKQDVSIAGKNTESFEGMIGLRLYDTFRIEANYVRTDAEWNSLSFSGDTVFVNAIWDARIDSIYRFFRSQMLVPYVGIGAGLSWNKADNGVKFDNKISPTLGAMAGISVEFNPIFALDFGYRYFFMFNPKTDIIADWNPTAHQVRAGARISF